MNPPFGTKESGIDMVFLEFAMSVCEGTIYSMHKSSTRKFVKKFCELRGYVMEILFEVKFPLRRKFKGYHKKDIAYTDVDVVVVKPTKELFEKRREKDVNQCRSGKGEEQP
jgi:predicted RNA methylase